jgi:hypothetical protein
MASAALSKRYTPQEYLAIERAVEFKSEGDDWLATVLRSMDETLSLPSIDCHVPLREIYARIKFPEAPPRVAKGL